MLRKRLLRTRLARTGGARASGNANGEHAGDPATPLTAALTAAIGWLSRRDFGSAELAERLGARGHDADTVGRALTELIERRYIDDERYARQFVATHAARGQGPLRIRHELIGVGLTAVLAEAALSGYAEDHGDWVSHARQVRVRRFGTSVPQSRPELVRQARFLQYRGFSTDHIRGALGDEAARDAD